MNVDRLVEQARQMLAVGAIEVRYGREYDATILAGLADAVEKLKHDLDVTEEANENLRRMLLEVKERDDARARVAALEAEVDRLREFVQIAGMMNACLRPPEPGVWCETCAPCVVTLEARALLDGRVPSTGQETT